MTTTTYALAYKPFQYPEAIEFGIVSERIHWIEDEAELQEDVKQWKTNIITTDEKNHITQILKLFTQTDVQVASNYCDTFIPYFKNHEVRQMLMSFAAREAIHQRAYALLNDTLGLPEEEYASFLEIEDMKAKMEFMKPTESTKGPVHTMAKQLAQTVCSEGMSLFSAFAMLLNYQRTGKMKGMCTITEWSIRDETLHVQGMTWLFRQFCKEYPEVVDDELKKEIYKMYRKAVKLEDAVIDLAYDGKTIDGLSASDMKQYIRYIADRRLTMLGLKPNYNIETNPLPWLDWIMSGDTLKNFFEGRVSDYSVGNLTGDWGWE